MNNLWVVLLLTILVFVKNSYGEGPAVKDDDDDDEGQYEIIAGNCTSAVATDMVFHDHVHKLTIPFVTRNATSTWYGDQKIYCLQVLNEDDESNGSTAFVKYGGVGHDFVTVEMHSIQSHGFEFTIQVYGK